MPKDDSYIQESFEQYIRTRKLCTKYNARLDKKPDGQYRDVRVNGHWHTWKSAYIKAKEDMTYE